MMSQYCFKEVRKLRKQGLNKSQVAKKLNINWKTCSKYWESNSPPEMNARVYRTRQDPLVGFEPQVDLLLKSFKEIKAVDVFERLRKEGYSGSSRSVERRVEKIEGAKPKERFFEQEYKPGEQTQIDFKECVELPFVDGVKSINLHYSTLPYSGKTLVKGFPFLNYECFIDGIHSFFEGIGGVTENIRIDNLSPCVKKVLQGRKRLWTDRFQQSIDHYGFGVLPCTPAKGNEKGHVERDIKTFTRRIVLRAKIDAIVFQDWDHFNKWLTALMEEEQGANQELQRKFKQEQDMLDALATKKTDVLCKIESHCASAYGTIRFGKSIYSVPDTVIGTECRLVIGAYKVEIYRGTIIVASHIRQSEGKHSMLLEHILPSLIRKPQAMIRWAHREILFPEPIFNQFYEYLVSMDSYSAEREFLRSINLVQYTDLRDIATGMELLISTKSTKPFEELKDLLLLERRPCSVIDITTLIEQRPLKPKLSDYDCFIPKTGASHI